MNASFHKVVSKGQSSTLFLIALMAVIMINLVLYIGITDHTQLLFKNTPVRSPVGVSLNNPAIATPIPVPTPPAGQSRLIVTPALVKASQPAPAPLPVPSPPVRH